MCRNIELSPLGVASGALLKSLGLPPCACPAVHRATKWFPVPTPSLFPHNYEVSISAPPVTGPTRDGSEIFLWLFIEKTPICATRWCQGGRLEGARGDEIIVESSSSRITSCYWSVTCSSEFPSSSLNSKEYVHRIRMDMPALQCPRVRMFVEMGLGECTDIA